MIKAVLFDLDDTLLGNHMDTFIPQYFALLSQYFEAYFSRNEFLRVMMTGTHLMSTNVDPALTNRDVFWEYFFGETGFDSAQMEPFFHAFYENQFLNLESIVTRRETAVPLIQACQSQNLKVVIATNPLFPSSAIEARLCWAGLPVSDYNFDLITTFDVMHAAKPQPAYYEEILAYVEVAPDEALMVGDNWEHDIEPAAQVGCFTYWLPMNGEASPPDPDLVTKLGTLETLYELVTSGWLTELTV
jgi:HAD superfamily hydrolase (TIGR01549 family)